MPRICGNKEAMRREYLIIKEMEQEIEKLKKEIALCEAMIKSSKAAIRNTYKEQERYAKQHHWQQYNLDPEWDWERRHMWEVYDYIFTEEDEQEYREWNTQHVCYYDGRDCTGQWFTQYISIFRIPELNRTIVYHSQGLDV